MTRKLASLAVIKKKKCVLKFWKFTCGPSKIILHQGYREMSEGQGHANEGQGHLSKGPSEWE